MSSQRTEMCAEVEESLADILDGTAPARLIDHVAECDICRDQRHEAEQVVEALEHTGADFRPSEGFAERMIAAVEEARPGAPAGLHLTGSPVGRQSGEVEALPAPVLAPRSGEVTKAIVATAPTELAPSALAPSEPSPEVDMNRTTFDPRPPVETDSASDPASSGAGPNQTVILKPEAPVASASPVSSAASAAPSHAPSAAPSSREVHHITPGVRKPVEAITGKNDHDTGASRSGSSRETSRSPYAPSGESSSRRSRSTVEEGPMPVGATVDGANDSKLDTKRRELRPATTSSSGGAVLRLFKKPQFVAPLALAMAAASVTGIYLHNKKSWKNQAPETAFVDGAWSGSIESTARAATDGASGVEVCTGERADKCAPLAKGGAIQPGSTVRTDARTRARLNLVDGTVLSLDRSSEVSFAGGSSRQAKILRGLVVADVAKADKAAPAKFVLPQGEVVVSDPKVDAKLSITTTDHRSAVEVARSEVKCTSPGGEASTVRAGEEANMNGAGAPLVGAKHTMSDMLEWSDQSQEEVDGSLKGIGELRAKKPGDTKEKDRAVRLSKHEVKVRVVDVVARTEVDETFTNDTGDQLEGIYRFPLPPDADIEKLSLEVDGKLIDGAFVDRDKGAAIWRGAIQNAAPQIRQTQEIIWVPGPWRDPALLEWQRGGRFELHIFPIPAHGSRRVVLTYTQKVAASGGIRRFSYPLGLDASGANKIDDFGIDLQILGLDKDFGVTTRGYQLTSSTAPADGARFVMNEKSFIPAGDLTVEYALPNRDKEMTAWAYQMDTKGQGQSLPLASNAPAPISSNGLPKSKAEREAEAKANADSLSNDASPFVALALRPNIPRWGEGHERLHVIVVDSSRSMIGERFSRATRLAAGIVREMDRRDSFMLLACDTTCQGMNGGAQGGASSNGVASTTASRALPEAREPSPAAAEEVERFLGSIEPDGGSNLFTAVQAARSAAGSLNGKDLRVIYLGDGTPTVGPTKASTVEAAIRQALPAGDGSLIAVALGSDADTTTLAAMARAGGGVMVPYVPGQRVAAASIDVLAAAYGSELTDVRVDLPAGLTGVTPSAMDSIPAGGEAFVYARMTGSSVKGDVVLHGRVHGEPFQATYPADLVASTSAGNAFVPRLFAAAKIADLERGGRIDDKEAIIALSQRFAVASRFTSLLVLESEAMFKAFGLDRNAVDAGFSGETGATSTATRSTESEAQAAADAAKDGEASGHAEQADKKAAKAKGDFGGGAGAGLDTDDLSREKKERPAPRPADEPAPSPPAMPAGPMATAAPQAGVAASPPPPPSAHMSNQVAVDPNSGPGWRGRDRGPRRMIPMRKVWDRKATFVNGNVLATQLASTLSDLETASKGAPDSRDKTVALYQALMASGQLGEASELAARWAGRDALDPDALTARADLAAMSGDRDKALRILSGLADVRPGDKAIQQRLATTFTALNAPALACQHRIALADIDPTDTNALASAALCSQTQGFNTLSTALLDEVDPASRDRVTSLMKIVKLDAPQLFGDVGLEAKWNAPVALDVALIDKSGHRLSALGSPIKFVTMSCSSTSPTSSQACAVNGMTSGNFVIEVTRSTPVASSGPSNPVSGNVLLTLPGGEQRTVPFTLVGNRVEVGTLNVFFTSRLVPVEGWGGGGWGGPVGF